MLNSIVWVAGAEVPEGGVKSLAVTEDELNANLDVYKGKTNPRIELPVAERFMGLPPAKFVTGAEHKAAIADRKNRRQRKKKSLEEKNAKNKKKAG